ncbi:MAG: cobalt-precorrin-6A synthase, partial [Armatimonadetes bacterium]|nr:cobalt-precorrin-6A synthase [Armatimonadota bacterium]NIO98590.1 cobalt-precorrin-6A synthase [Armatimonadota bacterium]
MRARGKAGMALRRGFTTGTCAAAAAQAAAIALVKQETVGQVELELPQGDSVNFNMSNCSFDRQKASCSVIKDAGDDPDVTNG